MPYPKRLLNEGEDLALDLRPHWWYFWKHIMTGVPLFVALILILSAADGDTRKYLMYVWAILAIAWAVWLAVKYVQWNFTHFVVTSQRVIYRTGALSKHGVEIPMDRINNINFHQRIWERIIGAGDLEIESAGKDGQSRFEDVWHPDGVQQELYRQMEAYQQRRAAMSHPPTASAGSTIPDQLQQLAELRDRGIISHAEFESKKAQLLERM